MADEGDHPSIPPLFVRADRLLHRLSQAGIATFLLISAFDIHRWRVDDWQAFDSAFEGLATQISASRCGRSGSMPWPFRSWR